MRAEEKLYLAMSEISDEIVEEASTPYKKPSFLQTGIVKAAAILVCASVLLITATTLPTIFSAKGGASPELNNGSDGSGVVGSAAPEFTDAGIYLANVQYDKENARYTFKLIVAEYHEKLDIYIYGLIDDDGDKVPVICTTSDELIGDYARVVRPIITVNGEMCENLPTAIDVYDVIVDMSETDLENVDWTNTIYTKELSQ